MFAFFIDTITLFLGLALAGAFYFLPIPSILLQIGPISAIESLAGVAAGTLLATSIKGFTSFVAACCRIYYVEGIGAKIMSFLACFFVSPVTFLITLLIASLACVAVNWVLGKISRASWMSVVAIAVAGAASFGVWKLVGTLNDKIESDSIKSCLPLLEIKPSSDSSAAPSPKTP